MSAGAQRMNPEARIGAVEVRVDNLHADMTRLSGEMRGLQTEVRQGIAELGTQISRQGENALRQRQTNWATIAAWISVGLGIVGAFAWALSRPFEITQSYHHEQLAEIKTSANDAQDKASAAREWQRLYEGGLLHTPRANP